MSIQVLGVKALGRDFERLAKVATTTETRRAFRAGAGVIRDEARRQAPRGRSKDGAKQPGQLRRSIVSFLGRRTRKGEDVVSFARVNVLKGRVKAPHGHLVEFGTAERRPKTAKFMIFRYGGKVIRARKVRGMRANPYFARAVSGAGDRALQMVTESLKKQIEGK